MKEKLTGVVLIGGYREDDKVRALVVGETDDPDHNCDALGCPSMGPHALYDLPVRVQDER